MEVRTMPLAVGSWLLAKPKAKAGMTVKPFSELGIGARSSGFCVLSTSYYGAAFFNHDILCH